MELPKRIIDLGTRPVYTYYIHTGHYINLSSLPLFSLYIYVLFIYIYVHIWIRRYDFPPKSFQEGPSGLFGAWQRANSSHCTHIWSHTYIYKNINTENCLGNSAPLYVQHILLEECPLYTSRGADIEYIFIYICTPSCLLNRTSEWHILSLLGGKPSHSSKFRGAPERERWFLFNIYIINIYIHIHICSYMSIYISVYIYPRLKDVIIYIYTHIPTREYI